MPKHKFQTQVTEAEYDGNEKLLRLPLNDLAREQAAGGELGKSNVPLKGVWLEMFYRPGAIRYGDVGLVQRLSTNSSEKDIQAVAEIVCRAGAAWNRKGYDISKPEEVMRALTFHDTMELVSLMVMGVSIPDPEAEEPSSDGS